MSIIHDILFSFLYMLNNRNWVSNQSSHNGLYTSVKERLSSMFSTCIETLRLGYCWSCRAHTHQLASINCHQIYLSKKRTVLHGKAGRAENPWKIQLCHWPHRQRRREVDIWMTSLGCCKTRHTPAQATVTLATTAITRYVPQRWLQLPLCLRFGSSGTRESLPLGSITCVSFSPYFWPIKHGKSHVSVWNTMIETSTLSWAFCWCLCKEIVNSDNARKFAVKQKPEITWLQYIPHSS